MLCTGTTRRDAAERTTITLKCPPDVGGSDVPTWSRDTVEIQQQRRFHVSPADNTLIITDLQPADSGLYYCDGKPAAYLNVSKDETSERGETQEDRQEDRNILFPLIFFKQIMQIKN